MLPSVATSALLFCAGIALGQEPLKQPVPLPSQVQPPPTQDQKNQLALEEEGRFTPPERADLFRVDSEFSLAERVRQLRKSTGKTELEFPDELNIRIKSPLEARHFKPMSTNVKPAYVVYQPLYFEQLNYERYGWDLGVFQPLVSTSQFYIDVLMLPYNFASNPPWHCEANAGYGIPGDAEPLRFLTPAFSWRGVAAQAGVMVGGAGIFP